MASNKIQVSIVIINFNTFDLTCRCIQSIIDFTTQISYEVILVDNASSECNPDDFLTKYPLIKLIKSKVNLGFAKGNNLGILNSQGEMILLLNSDTELLNDAISLCYKRAIEDNSIGLLTCKIYYPNGKFQHSGFKFPSIIHELKRTLRLYRLYGKNWRTSFYLGIKNDSDEYEADWLIGAYLMFSKNLLQKLPNNILSDQFFMYEEDIYWGYVVKKKLHLKNIVINNAKIVHYEKGSNYNFNSVSFNSTIYKNRQQWMIQEKGVFYTTLYFILIFLFESTQLKYPFFNTNHEILGLIHKTLKN